MKQNSFHVAGLVTFLTVLAFFSSCSPQYISFGVVLWSEDESVLTNGTLVGVVEDSAVQKVLRIEALDKPGTLTEVAHWRIKIFSGKAEAQSWIAKNEYLATFATVLKQALPVRNKADRQADMVYRLREQELVKIIGRADAPSVEGGMENYWYEILTESGTIGWTFGENLSLFNSSSSTTGGVATDAKDAVDVVARLRGTVWRPKSYLEMIKNRRYDLDVFAPEFGFFIDTNSKTYRIAVDNTLLQGNYERFEASADAKTYNISGTEISLAFLPDGTLEVYFTEKDVKKKAEFISMKDQISSIVNEEQARRQLILRRVSQNGASYVSGTYGTFQISGNRFSWIGAEALGAALPTGAGQGGTVSADLYVIDSAAGSYQGALSLRFDGTKEDQSLPVLYNISPLGIDLVPVPRSLVKNQTLAMVPAEAPIIEFSKAQ